MANPRMIQMPPVKELHAQILEVCVQEALSKYGMYGLQSRLTLEENVHSMVRDMIYTLRGYVAGKDRVEVYYKYFRWPENWWEAFKERWFPDFLLLRYPVKYHNETVESSHHHTKMCPHVGLGNERDHIDWLFLDFDEPYTYKQAAADDGSDSSRGQEIR